MTWKVIFTVGPKTVYFYAYSSDVPLPRVGEYVALPDKGPHAGNYLEVLCLHYNCDRRTIDVTLKPDREDDKPEDE